MGYNMVKRIFPLSALMPAFALVSCGNPEPETVAVDEKVENEQPMVKKLTLAELPTIDAGLAIGDSAPLNATLNSGDGETSLSAVLEDGPAVLIFTRSVEWCPFCQTQLKGVNGIVADLETRGYKLYGVSYDSVESQDRFSKNQMLNYEMLSDQSSDVIDAFGLRDPQYTEGKAVGVPYASVIVVDQDGKITAKSVSGNFRKRPTNEQILEIVDTI